MNWKAFIEEVKKEPKSFAKAVIEHLNPPKYAIEEIKSLRWMCHFCWSPRCDCCFLCQRSICEEHIAKTFIGDKTKLNWYVCPDCLKTEDEKEIIKKIREQDAELYEDKDFYPVEI